MIRTLRMLFAVSLVASAQAQGQASSVSGVVRDAVGNPIRDAVVVIDPDSSSLRTRTTADGRFRIDSVRSGERALLVARIGFRPNRSTIQVPVSGELTVVMETALVVLDTVAVRVARTGIHGVVTTRGISLLPHEPRPLRGATVEVLDRPYRTTTGRDGSFRIDAIGEGSYSLLVRLDRYQSRMHFRERWDHGAASTVAARHVLWNRQAGTLLAPFGRRRPAWIRRAARTHRQHRAHRSRLAQASAMRAT